MELQQRIDADIKAAMLARYGADVIVVAPETAAELETMVADAEEVRDELRRMGYTLVFEPRTSGPINAIFFDREHGTLWGGSSNHGEDYGIAW